jgi:IS1 family transposase
MGHDRVCYTLLLLAVLWLCMVLSWLWPQSRAAMGPLQPTAPRRAKMPTKAPKPFAGLIQKPLCQACQHATETRQQAPCALPPLLTCRRGRRRAIDTQQHFCPDQGCSYYGWVGRGNIRGNGHPGGRPWRQLQCVACHTYFQETHGTPLHGKRVPPEQLVWAVSALAEGLGIRAVGRVFEVDPNAVLAWLVEAADHTAAFSQYGLHNLRVTQVQLDELFTLLSAVKVEEVSDTEAIMRLSRSPHWVWAAIDPLTKLLLTIDAGDRTLAMAQGVIHQVAQVLAPDCTPLCLTDGFKKYITALLTHYGQWVQLPRRQTKGPMPKLRWMPLPTLLYAQVVKRHRRRRLARVSHRVVFGTRAAVTQVLTAQGWQINTAFIERVHLTIRQHVAGVGRRTMTLCNGEDGLRQKLALYQVY